MSGATDIGETFLSGVSWLKNFVAVAADTISTAVAADSSI
jgi:hypothetical protein